jgi:branched-chain amino acid transport system substrate-binding protein
LQAISGAVAFLGDDQVRGIQLAIEDYGDINGHAVNLGTPEDDLCSAEGGQAGAQAILAQEGVIGVIGTTCSGAAAAASPLLSAAGMVLISGSNTSPSLTSDQKGTAGDNYYPGYYRTAHNDLFQGATAARFAFEELGLTKAAAIHDGDPYTDGLATAFADAFAALGGEVVIYTAVNADDTDMTAVLTAVSAAGPEVVYFPIFQPAGDFIIQQAGGVAGLEDVVWFGADGLLVDDFLALPESEGMYFSGPGLTPGGNQGLTGTTYDELITRYVADFGETPPAAFHAHTYDATMMLLSAIEAVAVIDGDGVMWVDRSALRRELENTTDFAGMIGTLSCDDFGDCGSQFIGIYQHLDSGDPAARNQVYTFSPTG